MGVPCLTGLLKHAARNRRRIIIGRVDDRKRAIPVDSRTNRRNLNESDRQIELIAHAGERAHRSVQLSPGEVLLGAHALGSKRLLTASDQGLFVFDLERQLYLVGHIPLSAHRVCLPEGLVAAGDRLCALTDEGVYRLRVSSGD